MHIQFNVISSSLSFYLVSFLKQRMGLHVPVVSLHNLPGLRSLTWDSQNCWCYLVWQLASHRMQNFPVGIQVGVDHCYQVVPDCGRMQDECGLHIWLLLSFLHPHSPIRRRCWYLTEYQKVRSKSKPFSFLMIVMVMITLVGKTFSRPAASAVRCEDGMAIFKLYPHCSITYTLAQFLFKHALWSLVVPSSYTSLFLLSHILLCQLLKLH